MSEQHVLTSQATETQVTPEQRILQRHSEIAPALRGITSITYLTTEGIEAQFYRENNRFSTNARINQRGGDNTPQQHVTTMMRDLGLTDLNIDTPHIFLRREGESIAIGLRHPPTPGTTEPIYQFIRIACENSDMIDLLNENLANQHEAFLTLSIIESRRQNQTISSGELANNPSQYTYLINSARNPILPETHPLNTSPREATPLAAATAGVITQTIKNQARLGTQTPEPQLADTRVAIAAAAHTQTSLDQSTNHPYALGTEVEVDRHDNRPDQSGTIVSGDTEFHPLSRPPIETINDAEFKKLFPNLPPGQLYVAVDYGSLPHSLDQAARVRIGGAFTQRDDNQTPDVFALQAFFSADNAVKFLTEALHGGERANELLISLAQSIENRDEQLRKFHIFPINPEEVAEHIRTTGIIANTKLLNKLSTAKDIRERVLHNLHAPKNQEENSRPRERRGDDPDEEMKTWTTFRTLPDDPELGSLQGSRVDTTGALRGITDEERVIEAARRSGERWRHRRPAWWRRDRTQRPLRAQTSQSEPVSGTVSAEPIASSDPTKVWFTADHPGWGPPPSPLPADV